ncbi:MAG: hypothetical protein H6R10_2724 [Rhodocyclaceae bacterium]|nr:hypothetical protein [Rhodocyclaceae bacterium]
MSHPLSYFQALYVINLPSRADRRRDMDRQLAALGLGLDHPAVRLFPAIRPGAPAGFPSIGARGCFLSHLTVLREARERRLPRLAILEDDLNFAPDCGQRLPALVDSLAAADWTVFYGGHRIDEPLGEPAPGGLLAIPSQTAVHTTHFIALNGPVAIAACVAHLEAILARRPGDPRGGPMHVDGAYTWFRRAHPDAATLLAVPELGYQRSSRTDVHDLRWFDRLPVAREAVAWLRQWRNA